MNLSLRQLSVEALEERRVLATLSGSVYLDANADGEFSDGEHGIEGIAVTIEGIDHREPFVLTTSTDESGFYSFQNLPKGEYQVFAEQSGTHVDGDETIGSRGGVAEDDVIRDIKLKKNHRATGYLFGELPPASLSGTTYKDLDRDNNYDAGDVPLENVAISLQGTDDRGAPVNLTQQTAADGSYLFDQLRPGSYELQATTPDGLTDGRETLGRFDGNSTSIPANGNVHNDRFDSIQLSVGNIGRHYNFGEFDDSVTSGILATEFDTTLVVDGTSGDDNFRFVGGTNEHTVMLNGETFTVSASNNTQIVFYGHGGTNTAELTGGPSVDQVELRESSAKLTGTSYQVLVYTTRSTTAQSGGGEDRALLYDTIGDDTVVSDATGIRITGADFEHSAFDFHRTYAYATEGHDIAELTGTDGDDRYSATATDARMYGQDYYNYVRNFDVVHGQAGLGADDRAYLYDSDGSEVFEAVGNESRLYNVDGAFDNYAHGFDRVYAYSSGGDVAAFTDTSLSDYYKVDSAGARMYGPGYYNRAIGFTEHFVQFNPDDGQTDRVAFHDSAGDDWVYGLGSYFAGSRDGEMHHVWDADVVLASATTGQDQSTVLFPSYEYRTEGNWGNFWNILAVVDDLLAI